MDDDSAARVARELTVARELGALTAQQANLDKSIRDGTTRIEARLDRMAETFVTKTTFNLFRAVVFGAGAAFGTALTAVLIRIIFG